METGDLCADTAPMPKSKACQDPGAVNDSCGVTTYRGTPFRNYMSYAGSPPGRAHVPSSANILQTLPFPTVR